MCCLNILSLNFARLLGQHRWFCKPCPLSPVSVTQVELATSFRVYSLILSSHLVFCLPLLLLFLFTVSCRIVFAKPEDLEMRPNLSKQWLGVYHNLHLMRTSSLVVWSLYGMFYISSQTPAYFLSSPASEPKTHRHTKIWIWQESALISITFDVKNLLFTERNNQSNWLILSQLVFKNVCFFLRQND